MTTQTISYRFGFLLLAMVLVLTAACDQQHHVVTRGFYYWKTSFKLSHDEEQQLTNAGCTKLYLRCFDVVWNENTNRPQPVGILSSRGNLPNTFSYVPVVFITQQVIARINTSELPALAENTANLLQQLATRHNITPNEVQIDCDWTATTRDRYFAFLELLKKQPFLLNKKISCTVRLHQVKYRKTSGIPPVDRALIMCYNVGNLKQPGSHNSIIDVALTKNYLDALDEYPLPADIALPIFSWCLHFRGGKLQGILRVITPDEVPANPAFTQRKKDLFVCRKDTLWQGYAFLSGDELRIEGPSLKNLLSVARFTSKKVRNDSLNVLFFHADSLTLAKFPVDDLKAVYRSFQ